MENFSLKKILPHLFALVLFLAASTIYYLPEVSGKKLTQSDNIQAHGMQAEGRKVAKETGSYPLWTNGTFAGMPTYQIFGTINKNVNTFFNVGFLLFRGVTSPLATTFLLMLGFYILMIVMRVDWRIAIVGSLLYGLGLNNMLLAEAGHSTKLVAQGYLAPVVGGVLLAYRGRYLLGSGLMGFFLSLQVYANHYQITYYLVLILLILAGVKLYYSVKENTLPNFVKASGFLVVAGILALGTNLVKFWTTYEYSKESTRGHSELSAKEGKTGLDQGYAFSWSYGKLESMTLLIPHFYGGGGELLVNDKDSETYKAFRNASSQFKSQDQINGMAQLTKVYWGDQPFTSGPIYYGAVVVFLFFLGVFIVQGWLRSWILITMIFSFFVGWGRNLEWFGDFMFNYFPMYNNFRTVSMIIGMSSLFACLLGLVGLQKLFSKGISHERKKKAVMLATATTAGLCVLGLLMSFFLGFERPQDVAALSQFPKIVDGMIADRRWLLQADALRSLMFVLLAGATLWAFLLGKGKWFFALAVLGLLGFVDQWTVGKRYVNDSNFVKASQISNYSKATATDLQIQRREANNPHYRVLDISRGNPYSSAIASYHHKSLGGYHAAKLMIYNELVDTYLSNPIQNMNVLEMLNTRYIINYDQQSGSPVMVPTGSPNGNAWFVNSFELVENADAEILALAGLKTQEKAVIQKRFADYLTGLNLSNDLNVSNSIKLTSYNPDKMVYESQADKEQLAVFSEIYYPPSKGWKVFIDDKQVEGFVKADYVLRALRVPAGKHKIEMRFEPTSFYTGKNVALIASLLILGLFGFGIFKYLKGRNWDLPDPETVEEEEFTNKPTTKKKVVPTTSKSATKKSKKKKK